MSKWALLLVFTASSAVAAETAPAPRALDQYGYPLPEGAIARIGSLRLRHTGLMRFTLLADSKTAVTVGSDRTVCTWDLASGRLLRRAALDDDPAAGWQYTLSRDGRTVVAYANHDGRVTLFDASGRRLETFNPGIGQVDRVAFSPDERSLAIGSFMGRFVIRDRATGRSISLSPAELKGRQNEFMYALRFSPDGKWVLAGGGGLKTLCLYDAATGDELFRLEASVYGGIFSPDGRRLATCGRLASGDGWALIVIDLTTGRRTSEVPLPNLLTPVSFTPDGRAVSCGGSRGGCVVDLVAGTVTHRMHGWLSGPVFTADGSALVAAVGSQLRVWDPATGRDRNPGGEADIGRPAVSPDGRSVAAVSDWFETVGVWELATGRHVRGAPVERLDVSRNWLSIDAVGFTADGRAVTVGLRGGVVRTWDVATGAWLASRTLPSGGDHALVALPTGGKRAFTLASAHERGVGSVYRLASWDLRTGQEASRRTLPWKESAQDVRGWGVGDETAVVTLRGGVVAYPAGAEQPVALAGMAVLSQNVRDLPPVVSDDGQLVAGLLAGNPPQTGGIAVWEAATGRRVLTLPKEQPSDVALVPAAGILVTAGNDGLAVFDLATGRERLRRPLPQVTTPKGHAVYGLACTPDGRRAVTVLADGTALVWDLPARRDGS